MWFKAIGYVFAVMLFLEALLNAMGYIPKDPTNQAKKGVSAFSLLGIAVWIIVAITKI